MSGWMQRAAEQAELEQERIEGLDAQIVELITENKSLRSALSDFITEYKETHEDCDCGACVLCYGLAALQPHESAESSGEGESE